ncbi:MAG TPA: AarF/UbiB family protein [Acidimicrobiales bacterium]|nr:AarF/UbiB family protein [Acidimicrobiales bacterium]
MTTNRHGHITRPAAPRHARPFAGGPPPAALVVEAPPLKALRPGDVGRLVVVFFFLGWSVLRALLVGMARRGARNPVETACHGLVDGFIHLGPTFVKAGQIIASSGPLFPTVLATAARRCLDAVPPFPTEQVRATIEDDLGAPVQELFSFFDDVPLSAASIGQVHACTLSDGRQAVVKVQRPRIAEQMARDLRNGYRLAWLVEKTPWGRTSGARDIIRDVHAVTFEELNPAREAWQQDRFRRNIGAFGDNSLITAPEVYWDYCGPRVICMERVYGVPMDDFGRLATMGIDAQLILRWGAKVWAEAVMVHGPFHGDMHAGNVWALHDGRGCYLDFGIMGELEDDWKQVLKDLFYTCCFDLDFTRVAAAYRRVGVFPPGAGSDEEIGAFLNSILGPILRAGYSSVNIGQLVTQSLDLLKAFDAVAPRQLVLIAKQLLYIDRYARHLAPDYTLTADPLIVKNIFPAEAAAKAAELGVPLDDVGTALVEPNSAAPNGAGPNGAEPDGKAARNSRSALR